MIVRVIVESIVLKKCAKKTYFVLGRKPVHKEDLSFLFNTKIMKNCTVQSSEREKKQDST